MKTPPGAKCFVPKIIYDNRSKNVLRGLKEPTRVIASVLGKDINHRYVYDVELQERSINTRVEDFTLQSGNKEAMVVFF